MDMTTTTKPTTAAQEAAISRLYGGIHDRIAIEEGLVQGRCIGERIAALDFQKAHEGGDRYGLLYGP
jgi:hypothetical protein